MADILKLKKRAADFEAKRQGDKALAVYRDMIEVYESGEEDTIDIPLYNRVGDLLQRAGNLAEAVSVWEKAVDHYTEGGFYNPAIALCNKILRQSPGRTVVYYKLGRISAEKGFKADARQNFIEYAARMQKAGNLDEAFRALKEFADLVPDQGDVRVMLADQLLKANRKDEAVEQLQVLHAQLASDGRTDEAQEIAAKMKAIDPAVEPRADGATSAAKSGGLVFLDLEPSAGPVRGSHAVPVEHAPKPVRPPMPGKVAKAVEGLELIDLGEDEPPAPPKRAPEPAARAPETAAKRPSAPSAADDELHIERTQRDVEAPRAQPEALAGLETTSFGEIDLDMSDVGATSDVPAVEGLDLGIVDEGVDRGQVVEGLDLGFVDEATSASDATAAAAREAAAQEAAEAAAARAAAAREAAAREAAAREAAAQAAAAQAAAAAANAAAREAEPPAGTPAELEFHVVDEPPVRRRTEPKVEQRVEPPELETELSPDASLLDLETSDFVSFGDVEPPTAASSIPDGFELLEIESSEGVHALPLEEPDSMSIIDPAQEYAEAFAEPESPAPVPPESAPAARAAARAAAQAAADDTAPIVEAVSARTTSVTLAFSVDSLRDQLEGAPDDAGLRRQYAEALLDDGQRDEGIAELELSLAAYEREGDLDTAASVAEEIVRLSPTVIRYHQKRVEFAFRANDRRRLAEAYVELADALVHDGQAAKARVVYQRVLDISPDDLRAQAALETIADLPVPEPTPVPRRSHAAKAVPAARPAAKKRATAAADDEFVSLGDWLREEEAPKSTRMIVAEKEPTGDEQADFNDMLRAFKQGISDNVDEEDHEAHYDLGVAYKEMGLIDEAISEFQIALRGTTQRARAFEALGHCFVEKGQLPVASTILQRALNEPAIGDEDLVGVLYLLGAICEELQNFAEAKRYYQRVFAVDIQFRDVGDRLNTVEKSLR